MKHNLAWVVAALASLVGIIGCESNNTRGVSQCPPGILCTCSDGQKGELICDQTGSHCSACPENKDAFITMRPQEMAGDMNPPPEEPCNLVDPCRGTPDFGVPPADLAQPNSPDLAVRDFGAGADLAAGPDMVVPPDMVVSPDLLPPPPLPMECRLLGDGTAVAIGDLNDDGFPDLAATVARWGAQHRLDVYLQDPNPPHRLKAPVSYLIDLAYTNGNSASASVDIGDLDGDGKDDVVVNAVDGFLAFYQKNGALDIPYYFKSSHSSHSNVYKIRVGDVTGDGIADVVAIDWGTQSELVEIYTGTAKQGDLTGPDTFVSKHGGWDDLKLFDVNGDSRLDIVVMSGQTYAVANFGVSFQSGGGKFDGPYYFDLPGNELTDAVAGGDVDGDGDPDVVVTYGGNRPRSHIGIFPGDGMGYLSAPISYSSYDIPSPVSVADMDGDGIVDIVVEHYGWGKVGMYLHDQRGTLMPERLFPCTYGDYNAHSMTVGDLNSDGRPEVVLTDIESMTGGLYILDNRL